ncbi:phenoloxidase 1-like [Schistocerca americana]|uniref:phenoloxidase 1-like n=1 Tax=Schistocerca americana TaxID=7009 RepID=UPI001F501DC9|nr:phenoloxidase 1-like [Schistocerca americana]XP_046989757.1 phenoloxidase 1-like [Schistocerca americana]XP_047108084.1 phenoloxidase 1-like [Schistocerca piceifrons]
MNTKYLCLIFGVIWCNSVLKAQRPQIKPVRKQSMHPRDKMKFFHLVMERLNEPISLRKGIDRDTAFSIPTEYHSDRFQTVDIVDRSGFPGSLQQVDIKRIKLPDITSPMKLDWKENFSIFLPAHREYAAELVKIFMEMENVEDLLSASVYCRERINPYLFVYAMSVAITHRTDTLHLPLPSLAEVFPDKFMDRGIFSKARQEANIVPPGSRVPIEIPVDYTASNLDPEHRVSYFREDIGINLCHWYWHIIYPGQGPFPMNGTDRAGELFYYYHQQIVARYDFERLSNDLGRVERFIDWHKPIKEGYFPKLDNILASRVWPSRQANSKLQDINRKIDQFELDIQDLERWQDRLYDAIHRRAAIDDKGNTVPLTENTGMDILSHILQSTILSINQNYYGQLHNFGHLAISWIHDPDGRNLEGIGVMGDTAVSMRDPVFYRWHKYLDDIFQELQNMFARYTVQQLDFPGVTISSVDVVSKGAPRNEFATFWQKSDIDLYRGLDFTPRGSVFARVTHLQHAPFKYIIEVNNAGPPRKGTLRIFMAPKYDERGVPMLFRDQKHLFIELDHFTVRMDPGCNKYERHSIESSVTVPSERTFSNLNSSDPIKEEGFAYCGCGWPQHMLIPKGTTEGFPAELFVMITDYDIDKVEQPPPEGCQQPFSYCGWRRRLFPDTRAMGYPFDRMPRAGVSTLQQFLTPNMKVVDVKIRFNKKVVASRYAI